MKIRSRAKKILSVACLITLGLSVLISEPVMASSARQADEIDTNAGRIAQIEWSDDGRSLTYTRGDHRCRFDLENAVGSVVGKADRGARRDSSGRFGDRKSVV